MCMFVQGGWRDCACGPCACVCVCLCKIVEEEQADLVERITVCSSCSCDSVLVGVMCAVLQ